MNHSKYASIAKTALGVFLAVVLSLPVLSGCSGSSKEDADTIHLVVKVPRTGHDVVFDDSITQIDQVIMKCAEAFERDYEKGNVDIDVQVFEQNQYDAAIAQSFDTDSAPDILYGDYFNMSTYIHSGRVVPFDDMVDDTIRASIYDYLWDMSTIDGHIYMMPYLARQNVLAYNKNLFRMAGLDSYIKDNIIQSWSLDEWTYILDTLAAHLPEATYPMMMYAGSSQGDTHIMTLLRAAGSQFFDESGHFNLSTPEGIAALRWIQDGVSRGWFPPRCENLEIEDCSSLFRSNQLAIYMVNNASLGRYGDSVGLVNFPGPDADGSATVFVSGFELFDNGSPEKIAVAKDFLTYVYSNEDLMSYAAGTLPASKTVAEQYGDEILSYDLFSDNRGNVIDFTGNNPDTLAVRDVFYTYIHELLMGNITPEEAARGLDEACNEVIDAGMSASVLHQ